MLNTPFPPWPSYSEEEARAVYELVLSNKVNYWTGTETQLFEEEFAAYISTKHALAVSNGTVALDFALRTCELKPGDEVVVTPRSFIASASSVVLAGGSPVFAEVDADTQNLTAETIQQVLTSRTKAIVVVHLAGVPADMDPIMELANSMGLIVIEDCAQAHGAMYKGKHVGSIGHLGAWSFCQEKIMTTGGEGGMVTTNNTDYWRFMWSFRDHGKSMNIVKSKVHSSKFSWVNDSFGTNGRMLQYQSVFGRIQLGKLASWVETRRSNAHEIRQTASKISSLRVPIESDGTLSSYYKCYLFIKPEKLKSNVSRDTIIQEIVSRGVPCYAGACPEIYLEKAFAGTSFVPEKRLEVAKYLGETSLMFLVHPTLRDVDIQKTCAVLAEVMALYSLN